MQKLIIVFLCAISIHVHAQSFEGIITWQIKDVSGKGAPTSLMLNVKGTTIITVINGGMMNGNEMWFMNNDTKVMRVMRPQKMFVVVPPEALAAAAKAVEVSKFVKTAETAKVLTYTCTKYTGTTTAQGVTTKVAIWTTTEIKDNHKH